MPKPATTETWHSMLSTEQRKFLNAGDARDLLDYNPDTGTLTWKVGLNNRAGAGREAGLIQAGGYRRVGIHGRYYMAHRLAWLIATGEWPLQQIDHKNGVRSDNRLCNLRLASSEQNNRNAKHQNNTGLIGASYSSVNGKYRSQIRVDGKRLFLGWFSTAVEAHNSYVEAARKHHGEFSKC